MARRKKHEEHVNAEAWAIPYGDLVTLLFALFTVMYAMSSVNEGKFRVLSDSMVAAFEGPPKSIQPINVGEKEQGKGGDKQLVGVSPTALMKIKDNQALPPVPSEAPATAAAKGAGGENLPEPLIRMERKVQTAMQALIDKKLVSVRREGMWLEIEINSDILFPSDSGSFSPAAERILDKLAEVLEPFPNPIRVEGHTDDRPIHSAAYPSNWELSAARAASVVHQFSRDGVDPLRLQIVGYGEFHPKGPNDTAEGRNANRRVAVLVQAEPSPPSGSTPSGAESPRGPEGTGAATGAANGISSDGQKTNGGSTVLVKEHTAPPGQTSPVELNGPGQPAEGSAPPPPAHHE